jgi:molecular chaperone GrpE
MMEIYRSGGDMSGVEEDTQSEVAATGLDAQLAEGPIIEAPGDIELTQVPLPRNAAVASSGGDDVDAHEESVADLSIVLGEALEALEQGQAHLAQEMGGLRQAFDSKIKYESGKDKIIDSLHAELQTYRDDFVFKILRPVIIDLIDMYNDISMMLNHETGEEDLSAAELQVWGNLETFQGTIVEILARNGVEAFAEEGEQFVPKRQRAVRIVDTEDPDKGGTIAARLRNGFAYEDRVIAHERVVIYRYRPESISVEPAGDQ